MRMMDTIWGQDPADTIVDFLRLACKDLQISNIPKITLLQEPLHTKESSSFAAYRPSAKEIMLFVKNRHIMDVLRSLCHELVHYKQDIEGRLPQGAGATGSEQENEANAKAGIIMRKYGKIHPELF